jgi:hypothetical protein
MARTTLAALAAMERAASGRGAASSTASAAAAGPAAPSSFGSSAATSPPPGDQRRHGRDVLAIQRAGEAGGQRLLDAGGLDQGVRQARQRHVERHVADAGVDQRLGGDEGHLRIGLGRGAADQLDAGLGELALRRELAAAHAQHLAGVAEPQRPGRGAEPGGGDARNLRRGVARSPIMRWLTGSISRKVWSETGRAGAGQQPLLELQQRRLHALVAVAAKLSISASTSIASCSASGGSRS